MTAAEIRTRLAAIRPIADEARDDANALAKSRRERAIAVALAPEGYQAWITAEADAHAKHTLAKELTAEMDELRTALKAAERAEADHARQASVRQASIEFANSPCQIVLAAARRHQAGRNSGVPEAPHSIIEAWLEPAGLVDRADAGWRVVNREKLEQWARANLAMLCDPLRLAHELRKANSAANLAAGHTPAPIPGRQVFIDREATQ